MSVTIEQAFKQVLEAAIHQVKYKRFEREEDHDPVEAFIEDLFAVLFPQQQTAQAVQTVTVPTVAATVTVAAAPVPEKPKRGRKPKAAAPAPEAAPEPEKPEPKKRGRKPKTTTPPATEEETAPKTKNLEKLTATNKKHIKKWADEVGVAEPDTKALLAHVNAMSAEEFNGATFEQHVKSFLEPKQEEAQEGDELEEYEFNGKTYYVNKETDRVYEQRGEAYIAVGFIGMAAFAGMKKD